MYLVDDDDGDDGGGDDDDDDDGTPRLKVFSTDIFSTLGLRIIVFFFFIFLPPILHMLLLRIIPPPLVKVDVISQTALPLLLPGITNA